MNQKLTTKEYWDKPRTDFKPYYVQETEFSPVLDKFLPTNPEFRCVEIGAYPGTHLCYFAKKFGYHPTAIEFSDYYRHIGKLLEFNGIDNYKIINKDFFKVTNQNFDVVSSFGFVEHFTNYEEVIKKHVEFLKQDGFLVLSVPYLGGFQGWLRRLVYNDDIKNSVWSSHNTDIMNLGELKQIVAKHCSKILFADFVMGSKIWVRWNSSSVKDHMRGLVRVFNWLDDKFGQRLPSSKLYSPMILLIAKK